MSKKIKECCLNCRESYRNVGDSLYPDIFNDNQLRCYEYVLPMERPDKEKCASYDMSEELESQLESNRSLVLGERR